MRKILVIACCLCVVSCTNKRNKSEVIEHTPSTQFEETATKEVLDVKDILVQWNADNPKRPQEFDSGDTNKHKARVQYYSDRPFIDDYNDCRDMYTITELKDYTIYSRWRGKVYAFDKNREQYFLVWSESYNYNDKKVLNKGDSWIQMVYVEAFDMDDMTDTIMYNLETKEYYFMRVKNTFIGE